MSDLGNYVLQLKFGQLANDALSLARDIAGSLTTILMTFLRSLTIKFQRSTASNPASPLPSMQFLGQDLSTHLPVDSSSDLQSIHVIPSYPPNDPNFIFDFTIPKPLKSNSISSGPLSNPISFPRSITSSERARRRHDNSSQLPIGSWEKMYQQRR